MFFLNKNRDESKIFFFWLKCCVMIIELEYVVRRLLKKYIYKRKWWMVGLIDYGGYVFFIN